MATVELTDQEWTQVISIIAMSHPLVAKIAGQLSTQRELAAAAAKREAEHASNQAHAAGQHAEESAAVGAHPGERRVPRHVAGPGNSDGERSPKEVVTVRAPPWPPNPEVIS